MTKHLARILSTRAPAAVLVPRLLIAGVFIPEGIKKYLFAEQWGAGRFEKIGIPSPELMAHFVGFFEASCGLLILLGLATRLACLPLLTIMSVAIATTKIPLLWQATVVSNRIGFWSMQAESRTDFSQFMTLAFLLIVGAGGLSLDLKLDRKLRSE